MLPLATILGFYIFTLVLVPVWELGKTGYTDMTQTPRNWYRSLVATRSRGTHDPCPKEVPADEEDEEDEDKSPFPPAYSPTDKASV
jgi:hypothetical protein